MFNSKYSRVLTIALCIIIPLILAVVGYVIYDTVVVKSKINAAEQASEEFTSKIVKNIIESDENIDMNSINDQLKQYEDELLKTENNKSNSGEKVYMEGYEVMGVIKIPKTGIEYPILSEVTKKSLETSVAILYGVGLNNPGNTTIVGHNYRNKLFFSDNKKLSKGDKILITDQSGNTVTYIIYDTYITDPSDAAYMERDTEGKREISLSTCTDDSTGRLIILARESE